MTIESSKESLDELLRLKKDTGIQIGTLINYPLCMLGDLEKYGDFVGRGCPTQSGHRFNINSNGDTHGCVMEDKDYGNVYKVGLKEAYKRTLNWRNESYLYEGCKGCHYIDVCHSGCRMHSFSESGKMDGKDPFMPGKEFITKPFKFKGDDAVKLEIEKGAKLYVPNFIRFRKEDGFYLMNIRWANTIEITDYEGKFFETMQKNKKTFTYKEFQDKNSINRLNFLVCKEALKSKEINISVKKTGVNVDPAKLPDLEDESLLKHHPNLQNN